MLPTCPWTWHAEREPSSSSWQSMQPRAAAVLGLYGMGGIGKTTLAKAVFNDLQSNFGGSTCFVEVGRDADRQQLRELQQQMLKELCGIDRQVSNLDAGTAELQARLGHAPVLLVIDDIWSTPQLDALLVSVGQGSHVLVTTRDESLLRRPGIPVQEPVRLLDRDAAKELFSWCAFLQKEPPAAYADVASEAIQACSGLPLTLTIIGMHLWGLADREGLAAGSSEASKCQAIWGWQQS